MRILEENRRPMAYIVVLVNTEIKKAGDGEVGGAVENILLGAVNNGLGTCWMGSINKEKIRELFKEKSTVNYNDARIYPINALAKIAERNPKQYKFCPENLTKRIVIGAFQSRFTPIEILEELRIQYPNEYERHCKKDY